MSGNQYRATTKAGVAAYGDGVVDLEFSPSAEADALGSGALELAPRPYRVLSNNYSVPEGEVFEGAFLVEIEAALISGGHIERVRRDAVPTVVAESADDGESVKKRAAPKKD